MFYAIIGALVVILDQAVKYWVANSLEYNYTVKTLIPGVMSLVNVHNDGAAFSIFANSDARIYFIILTIVFTLAVIIALASNFISGKVARWSIVLVTAGGLANCIDRVIYGYVQDMFRVDLFNFAVFNVADIFITVFAFLFAIAMLFEKDVVDDDEDSILFENDREDDDRPSVRRKEERASKKEAKELAAERQSRFAPEAEEKSARKVRKPKYEDEFEQFKAKTSRPAREMSSSAAAVAAQQKAPANTKPADPFAEWEKASSRVAEKKVETPVANVVDEKPVEVKPVAAKPVAKSSDSFNLDDILSEFK